MIQVYSKAKKQSIETERIIGCVKGKNPGPTLIFFAGIHGNEPAGVFALKEVLHEITDDNVVENGTVYAIGGNLKALANGVRYLNKDLNRMWLKPYLNGQPYSTEDPPAEFIEMKSILDQLKEILTQEQGPFYFFDLHTTSSHSLPFITINDTMLNRIFAMHFDVPVILGIEEYLDGPLLSYVNTLGYISIGFESGQHDQLESIEMHKHFIKMSMKITGVNRGIDSRTTKNQNPTPTFYEIVYRHAIDNSISFNMCPGFENFQQIVKGEILAYNNDSWLVSPEDGHIFMPLYQDQGDDGYFIIQPIARKYLRLSSLLRRIGVDSLLTLLPGIRYLDDSKKSLRINQHIAKYFAKDFLHLMGYRVKQQDSSHLIAHKREHRKAHLQYKGEHWFVE